MYKNRSKLVFIAICVLLLSLALRIFYLQTYAADKLSKAASSQRISNSVIQKPRGNILDRNGISFTGRNKKSMIVLKPLYLRGREEDIRKAAGILGVNFNTIRREIDIRQEPIIFEADQYTKNIILKENIQGISVINYLDRYSPDSLARHVVGYLNSVDKTGEAGIEKSYDGLLKYAQKNFVGIITDAKNNALEGMGYRLVAEDTAQKVNVRLTLDYHIQKIVEEVMDRNSIKGAVVVEAVDSGDIVAISSKPDFDPDNVQAFLNSSEKELFNKAVASYNMGSIFKIIDVAEALEGNVGYMEEYFCGGSVKLGNRVFGCHKEEGHGWVDLKKAFAMSCNSYFIEMGIRLGHDNIIDMAKRFGLGSAAGIKAQGISESAGRLPSKTESHTKGDTANMSIGQGEVMVTPVQVADIVATVANGGIKNKINIVDSIVDDEGNILKKIRVTESRRIIRKDTAELIKELMEEVITNGTGTKANLEEFGGSGGKTGSAETGQLIEGQSVVQAWFAGYFPAERPKYAVAVFVENGKMGNEAAAPVFRQIGEEIIKKGY